MALHTRRSVLASMPFFALTGRGKEAGTAGETNTGPALTLLRDDHFLMIRAAGMADIRINYLEAYCRAGSTDADWVKHTVIPHRRAESTVEEGGRILTQRDELEDGVVVLHKVTAGQGEVDFRLEAHNPGGKASEAHWAQPCVRLGAFCGFGADQGGDLNDYLPKCFVWLDGKLTRMPFEPWDAMCRARCGVRKGCRGQM